MVELTYIGLLGPVEKGYGFVLLFPDVYGCMCEGESVEEVMTKAAPTLTAYLMTIEQEDAAMPIPRTVNDLAEDEVWGRAMKEQKLTVVAVTVEADVTLH